MKNPKNKSKLPLHIHISSLFLALIFLVGTVIATIGFRSSRDMLQSTATDVIQRIGLETGAEIEALLAPADLAINLVSQTVLNQASTFKERYARLPLLKEALLGSSALSSIYLGYENGDFFLPAAHWR